MSQFSNIMFLAATIKLSWQYYEPKKSKK